MATFYMRSAAAGTGDGSSWANAFTSMAGAIAHPIAAGDVVYVSDDHNEATASPTSWTFPGTAALPNQFICANHLGSVPPVHADLRSTAVIATIGANSSMSFAAGFAFFYGIIFNCGTASGASMNIGSGSGYGFDFSTCALALLGTGGGAKFVLGNTTASAPNGPIFFNNTTMQVTAGAQGISINAGTFYWRNTASAIAGATLPNTLIVLSSAAATMLLEGVDLSALSGKTLVGAFSSPSRVLISNCKLPASVTIQTAITCPGQITDVLVSDSSATTYNQAHYEYQGTLQDDSVVVNSSFPANDSVQTISWNVTTSANASSIFPFECFPIDIWNAKTGQTVNLNVHILNDGVTLTNSDIWAAVEYLSDSGSPLASVISSAVTLLSTAANIATDSITTWVTTGLTTPIKQVITVSFTPQVAGYCRVYVKIAKVSKTIWVNPAVNFS